MLKYELHYNGVLYFTYDKLLTLEKEYCILCQIELFIKDLIEFKLGVDP